MEKTQHTEELLKRIANHLLLNAGFSSNLGLYYGKIDNLKKFVHRFLVNECTKQITKIQLSNNVKRQKNCRYIFEIRYHLNVVHKQVLKQYKTLEISRQINN